MDKLANLLSIWWIFVLGVIAGGLVIGVTIYYSAEININEMHADVLGDRISKCMIREANLIVNLDNFDFFSLCKIDSKVFANEKFFAKILVHDGNVVFDEVYGNAALEEDCKIIENVQSKTPLRCAKRRVVASYGSKESVVEIFTGIKQEGVEISIVG